MPWDSLWIWWKSCAKTYGQNTSLQLWKSIIRLAAFTVEVRSAKCLGLVLQAALLAGSLWVVVPISQASEKYAIANMLLSRSLAFAAALALAAIFLAWSFMGGSPH